MPKNKLTKKEELAVQRFKNFFELCRKDPLTATTIHMVGNVEEFLDFRDAARKQAGLPKMPRR